MSSVWLFSAAIVGIGGLTGWLVSGWCGLPRWARVALLGSFCASSVLAAVSYAASLGQWPVGRALQMGDGFWTFASDAVHYHSNAVLILDRWSQGVPLAPSTEFFDLWVATVYRVFGVAPIYPALLNSWLWFGAALLAFGVSRRLAGSTQEAAISAAILAWWPSAFFWNSQVLREAALACVVLVIVRCVCALSPLDGAWTRRRWVAALGLLLGLYAVYYVRLYVSFVATSGGVALFGACAAAYALRSRWTIASRAALLVVIFASGQTLGMRIRLGSESVPPPPPPSARTASALERLGGMSTPYGTVSPERLARVRRSIANEPLASGTAGGVPGASDEARAGTERPETVPGIERPERPARPETSPTAEQPVTTAAETPGRPAGGWQQIILLVPRGLSMVLLAPWPTDWWSEGGATGKLKVFASVDAMLLYVLWPVFAVGAWRALRRASVDVLLILGLAAGLVLVQAVAIPNLGMVVRHRLPWVVLVTVLAGGSNAWRAVYGTAASRLLSRVHGVRRPPRPGG